MSNEEDNNDVGIVEKVFYTKRDLLGYVNINHIGQFSVIYNQVDETWEISFPKSYSPHPSEG